MDHKDFQTIQKLYEAIEKDKAQRQVAEIRGIQREANGSLSIVVNIVESMLNDEGSFKRALAAALQETIEKIASTIINDRRAEIEDACNFGELRDVLAAELARQFMASRLTDAATPFDKPSMLKQAAVQNSGYTIPGYGQGVGLGTKKVGAP